MRKHPPVTRAIATRPAVAAVLLLGSCLCLTPTASAADSVEKLQEFDLEQVAVTDPYYLNAFAKNMAYLTSLDVDQLMVAFKAVSQGQDPGSAAGIKLYGGWEGAWSLLRGHTMGHYLSAMARMYKQTKMSDKATSDQIAKKIDYAIGQLKTFQDKSSNGYLFGSPESHFDNIEGPQDHQWAPWYTMHKIIAGLLDVYTFEGNETALQIASKLGDWSFNRTAKWNAATRTKAMGIEYGGMNDCLYELYKLTSKANHLTAAHVFDEETLFTPISEGNDKLTDKHANTMIPKFIGALNRYRTLGTGEDFYFTAAKQFWTIVLRDHTYVTGGNSELEAFREAGKLDAQRDNVNNETCNSYNMLKLTRELFKITGDVKYADFYERSHINEIMSAINPETGMTTYFKAMGTGYFKVFGDKETFWCCNGTGMENYNKLNDSVYFHDSTDLYVNLYVSSTLKWSDRGLSLTQAADVPLSNTVTFTIDAAPTDAAKIKFREPYWLASCPSATVTINGDSFGAAETNGYLDVSRIWKAGDKVEITFPTEVQVSRLPDNPNEVAFTYGPIVLSAGLGTENMKVEPQWSSAKATIPAGVVIQDTIKINAGTPINQWLGNIKNNLVQTPGKLEFTLRNTDSDSTLKFTPHYKRYTDRYGIYFRLDGAAGGSAPDAGVCFRDGGATGRGGSGGTSDAAIGSGGTGGGGPAGGSSAGAGGTSAGGAGSSGGAGSGGMGSTGGRSGSGGTPSGSGGNGGGTQAAGGSAGKNVSTGSSGCSCKLGRSQSKASIPFGLILFLGMLLWQRRITRS